MTRWPPAISSPQKTTWRRPSGRSISWKRHWVDEHAEKGALYATGRIVVRIGAPPGIARPGIGFARNRPRVNLAMVRAQRFALLRRALSVAIPVFAYICR